MAVSDVIYTDKYNNFNKQQSCETVEVEDNYNLLLEDSDSDSESICHDDDDENFTDFEDDDESSNILIAEKSKNLKERSNFKAVLNIVRKVAKIFKKSPVKNSILQTHVRATFHKEYTLLLDCKTRWNSIVPMIERFLKLKICIIKALEDLNSQELIFSINEITSELEDLLKVISIFIENT